MREARVIQPTAVHHVIARFVDRSFLLRDDTERAMYLHRLGAALADSDWRCLAYALMSSHVHLALVAGTTPIGPLLKRIHSPFANWHNKRHDRLGPVFADRPAAWVVGSGSEGRLVAYIHSNPVRGNAAKRASASTWTSHRAYTGATGAPPWLDTADGLRRCGVGRANFDAWVGAAAADFGRPSLTTMNRAAHRFGAIELGTPVTDPDHVPLVARAFAHYRPSPRVVVELVAEALAIPWTRFCSRAPEPELVRARRVTLGIARRLGFTVAEMCACLSVTRQAGSRIMHRPLDPSGEALVATVAAQLTRLTSVTPSLAKQLESLGSVSPTG